MMAPQRTNQGFETLFEFNPVHSPDWVMNMPFLSFLRMLPIQGRRVAKQEDGVHMRTVPFDHMYPKLTWVQTGSTVS